MTLLLQPPDRYPQGPGTLGGIAVVPLPAPPVQCGTRGRPTARRTGAVDGSRRTGPTASYRNGPDMTHDELPESSYLFNGGQGLKNALHHVFDGQIPNYGAYNLVYADRLPPGGEAAPVDADSSFLAPVAFVVGYRWRPTELMIAPVDLGAVTAAGVPVEVNTTNLAHALQWDDDGTYEVGTSTGRIFRFGVRADHVLDVGPGTLLRLVQDEDLADFTAFMEAFIALA